MQACTDHSAAGAQPPLQDCAVARKAVRRSTCMPGSQTPDNKYSGGQRTMPHLSIIAPTTAYGADVAMFTHRSRGHQSQSNCTFACSASGSRLLQSDHRNNNGGRSCGLMLVQLLVITVMMTPCP